MKGHGLLQQKDLSCTSPVISTNPRASSQEDGEVQPIETFREALGNASLGMSDQQGNAVDLKCNITHSSQTPDITPPQLSSSFTPLSLSLSLSLVCGVDGHSYERLWRLMAYYSETPARLQREIMLSKAPTLAYRYEITETQTTHSSVIILQFCFNPNTLISCPSGTDREQRERATTIQGSEPVSKPSLPGYCSPMSVSSSTELSPAPTGLN